MAVHRSYWQSQATLIHNNPSNNSRNPIIELSYGGSDSALSDAKYSRYIFKVDVSSLRENINAKELQKGDVISHKIHIKNVISFAQEYIGGQIYDAKRGSGITAYLLPLEEAFDEGTGYDYLTAISSTVSLVPAINAPNWFYRRTNLPWATPGGLDTTIIDFQKASIASCELTMGNEDLIFNVTSYINNTLFNQNVDYGFMVCFAPTVENLNSYQRQVVTFFSKYTDSFFQPYLETIFSQKINERRCDFYLDEFNDLFLSSIKPFDSVDRVEIYDFNDELIQVIPQSQIKTVRPGLYKTTLLIDSEDYPDAVNFQDVWYYHLNNRSRKQEQDFTLVKRDLFSDNNILDSEFWCTYSGIRHNEVIPQSANKRKITINPKQLLQGMVNSKPQVDSYQYRLYVEQGKNQVEIIPFTDCYKLGDVYFLELDFSWMIPQFYFLEVRVVSNNAVTSAGKTIKFRVVF